MVHSPAFRTRWLAAACLAVGGAVWLLPPAVLFAKVPNASDRLGLTPEGPETKLYLEITRADASVLRLGPLTDAHFDEATMVGLDTDHQRFELALVGLNLPAQGLAYVLTHGKYRHISPRFTQPADGSKPMARFDFERAKDAFVVAKALAITPRFMHTPGSGDLAELGKLDDLGTLGNTGDRTPEAKPAAATPENVAQGPKAFKSQTGEPTLHADLAAAN